MKLEVVSATRLNQDDFWSQSALGLSIRRLGLGARLIPRIAFNNTRGLPSVYNEAIEAVEKDVVLLFVHDDVWIEDYFLYDRLVEALSEYEVIGVAGNRRHVERQPAWAFVDEAFTWDQPEYLAGAVAHGPRPFGPVSRFGSVPAACELLDGVFLAACGKTLKNSNVRFDPRFSFHFYDMDFCRTARQAGLRLGAWGIAITHQSGGSFGSLAWQSGLVVYRQKWSSRMTSNDAHSPATADNPESGR